MRAGCEELGQATSLPQLDGKLQATERKIMKRKIDNNDLTHYFIRDHRDLPASYLKSCKKFFEEISHKQQATSLPQSRGTTTKTERKT
jgi:hypothetical protein|tara:strand:+ start:203 stop:466 length:264 start_codon:yes stop_codon:yes gene_type:complete